VFHGGVLLARIFHEWPAATTDMGALPCVLGCSFDFAQDRRPLRRTVQVRLGTNSLRLPGGTPIFFALAALRSVPQAGSQFRGLATAIEAPCPALAGLKRDRESSKCKVFIPYLL
ncbi:MAG: hypothetical protein WBG91_12980, partial [Syntrophobacteria bacterium]